MLLFFLDNPISKWGLLGEWCSSMGWMTERASGVLVMPIAVSLISLFVYILAAYLLGSINTAVIVSKTMYKDDIRKYGSGNAGFTNMMRTFGMKAAGITFAGDILKAVAAVLLAWLLRGYVAAYIAGFACFIGHILPCFCQFKGGKGVLCAAAMMLVLDWRIFLVLVATFALGALITKYISFGSILAAMVFPLAMSRMNIGSWLPVTISFIMAAVVVFKHRENLKRIFNGTESKFSFKKSKKTDEANNG